MESDFVHLFLVKTEHIQAEHIFILH